MKLSRTRRALAAAAARRFHDSPQHALFQDLEDRTLMSFSAHVNFAPTSAAKVSGFVVDSGSTYGARNGLTYGWNTTLTSETRNRDASISPDQLHDTLIHTPSTAKWEMAVPNGTYNVHVVMGDPSYHDSVYKLNVEGRSAINFTPTRTSHWAGARLTVTVSDGRLTLSSASGAVNNKIDYVEIASSSSTSTSSTSSSGSTGSSVLKIAPAAPSGLSASGISTSQIKLTWTDRSSREQGFKLQRSSDGGSTYSSIATLGANTTPYTDSGRSSGKTYKYRLSAYNAYGTTSWITASGTTKSSTSSSTPAPAPTPNTGYFDGIQIGASSDTSKAIPILRDLGIKSVRLINGITSWSSKWPSAGVWKQAAAYHNAGFKVLVMTMCTQAATYSSAKSYFQWALTVPGVKSSVDRWEIQNEIDLGKYYSKSTDMGYYVNNDLKGAWDALHPAGETVVAGSPLFAQNAQKMVADGSNKYCDIASFHLYSDDWTVQGMQNKITQAKAIFGSKPLSITEWNYHGSSSSDMNKWASLVKNAHPLFRKYGIESAYYYRFTVMSGAMTGSAGVVWSDYSRHNPFYDAVKSWQYEA